MVTKIDKKIVSWSVKEGEVKKEPEAVVELKRPEVLAGKTYKIDSPISAPLYMTVNDNEGKPFEVFFSSKNIQSYQWMTALSRMISAVFRRTDNPAFVIEQLKSTFDPNGGYWLKGGKWMSSLVAHIGSVLERHIEGSGEAIEVEELPTPRVEEETAEEPPQRGSEPCPECGSHNIRIMDGCLTCLDCGYSKCG